MVVYRDDVVPEVLPIKRKLRTTRIRGYVSAASQFSRGQIKFTSLGIYVCVCVCVCIVEQALCPRKFEYKTVHVIRIARPRSKKFRVLGENWIYPPWIGSEGKRMERKFYCDIERWKLLRIIVFSRLRVLLLALVWFQLYSLSLSLFLFLALLNEIRFICVLFSI